MSMSESDVGYFYILHQIEFDLEVDHDELLEVSKDRLDILIEQWFQRRTNITGEKHTPTEELKEGVYDWKEQEKELERE
jgi:hypothetical protein